MDIREFQKATFEKAREHILSKGLKSLKRDDEDFFCEILMSGCRDLEEKIGLLVSAGVDVNAQTAGFPSGFTALSRCVKKGKRSQGLIELLLATGADIEAPSTLGLTPLHCAIIIQDLELVKFLISKGANPNAVDEDGSSCLMLALLSNDASNDRSYYWPFFDIRGSTKKPISIEILDQLVRSGATLDYHNGQDCSVVELVIRTGKIPIVDWMFQNGIKPTDTVSSSSSTTLLMSACSRGNLAIAKHLLELGANVDAADQDGQTALFYSRGNLAITKHLLELGANVDAVDQDGKTALFRTRDPKIAKALLDAGANLTHLDKDGHSLFQQHYFGVKIFQKYGKEFVRLGGDINAKSKENRNILHHLADHYDGLGALKLAIALGCDVNLQDQNGKSPLMLARPTYWSALFAAGARVNDVDANGDHALNLHLSEDLLEFGADINWANRQGQTPLMLAAKNGYPSLVNALLKAGANAGAIDNDGKLATDYADAKALVVLVEAGAAVNPGSASALVTAITGKNVNLSLQLLNAGLSAGLSDAQVKGHLALLEHLAQENLDAFNGGIFGDGDKAEKLISKIVADRKRILELAKARPVCEDEGLPQVLRPGEWPRKAETPTPHIKFTVPLNYGRPPVFNPPQVFDERMSTLHDEILTEMSSWEPDEQKDHRKEKEKEILNLCKRHKNLNFGLSSWDIYQNRFDVDDFLICSDSVILQLWNDCFDILSDLIHSYSRKISGKSKFELALYRLREKAFSGIKQGHRFAIDCLVHFDAAELALVMARAIGRAPAQTWLRRFSDTAIPGLLVGAFSDVLNDRSDAQQTLRWLAGQGFRDKIELSAKGLGPEAYATAVTFLDRSADADFLPKKLTKLPSYFVASAHPAPILKGSDKVLPAHAVETLARMMLASTCHLQTPALVKVVEVCDPKSLADFALSAYDVWVKNGAKKDGIGFLHALGYLGDARASALLIKTYRNSPFYPATAAAIEVLGALGSNAAISGLLTIMRFSRYEKAQAHAQEVLETVAETRGLTTEQLEDLAIPDLGLNADGEMLIDFGPRQFTASVDAKLDLVLTDSSGSLVKALPRVAKSDNARLANQATADWKEFKAGHKGLAADQLRRFEHAMVETRRWDGATFKEVIAVHPLLSKMVRTLVWAVAGNELKDLKSFRIDAGGRYVTANGEEMALLDDVSIILPHPLLIDREVPAWLEVFAREKLTQPILQLARKWFIKGTETDNLIYEKAGTKVPLGALRGLKTKGWDFHVGSAGMVWSVFKRTDDAYASIDVEPGWSLSGFDYEDFGGDQTIKLVASGGDPIAYSELVRDFLSLPVVEA